MSSVVLPLCLYISGKLSMLAALSCAATIPHTRLPPNRGCVDANHLLQRRCPLDSAASAADCYCQQTKAHMPYFNALLVAAKREYRGACETVQVIGSTRQ
jgi:hypothetical protein